MSKCQKCPKAATLHITEVLGDDQYEELHLCEECAHKYLSEEPQKKKAEVAEDEEETGALNQRECPVCGIKFVEFRNSGRLGCPHDYAEFREELTSLLENITGERKHAGRPPGRQPRNSKPRPDPFRPPSNRRPPARARPTDAPTTPANA